MNMKKTVLNLALLMAATALVVAEEPVYLMPTNPPALVGLAWDASPSVEVTGYNVYYGCGSRQYTNKVDSGPALTATVTNLVRGAVESWSPLSYPHPLRVSQDGDAEPMPPVSGPGRATARRANVGAVRVR